MAQSTEKKSELFSKIDEVAHSSRGKNALIYLLFLCIAFIFWLMLALNDLVQKDYHFPLEIVEVPDSITLIDELPHEILVSVKDKGSSLIKYSLGNKPTIKIKYHDITSDNNRILLSQANISNILQSKLGSNAQIISFTPDSIKSQITSLPGKNVKLAILTNISTNPQYIVCGDIQANVDSIELFGFEPISDTLDVVRTQTIVAINATDTIVETVKLILPNGIKAIPDKVTVTIPVEPLISKRTSIQISSINNVPNTNLVIFPSKCDVSYLTPMSKYHETPSDLKLKVIYNHNNIGRTKLPITLDNQSLYYQNISISPDSVEFIIEQK